MLNLGKAYIFYSGRGPGSPGKKREYIPISQLLPVWSVALASPGTSEDDAVNDLWDLIAYSIVHERVSFAIPEKFLDEIKIRAGWKHPYEHVAGPRIQELNRFMIGLGSSALGELLVAKDNLREIAKELGLTVPTILQDNIYDPPEISDERRTSGNHVVEAASADSPVAIDYSEIPLKKKQRGAKPIKYERTLDAMRRDIQTGTRTLVALHNLTEKELAGNYAVSRETARKALNAVALEIAPKSRQFLK